MRRLLVAGVLVTGSLGGGCSQTAPTPTGGAASTGRAAPQSTITFARAPIVTLATSGVVTTAVRTAPALPVTGLGLSATVHTVGADPNRGSELERIPGYRGCYANEAPLAAGSRLRPGQLVTVELRTEDGVVRARVPLRSVISARTDARRGLARALACTPGPRERRCTGSVAGNGGEIEVQRAFGGASCATSRAVLGRVAMWVDDRRCFEDLCVRQHRMNLGFRCAVAKVGEADWAITCRRGKQSVRGVTAE
jgi:hypothetical protein